MGISLNAMEKLLKEAGAERVGEDAKEALKEELEFLGAKIAQQAVKLAEHADRKTIKASDVKLASR